jgi:hypothetical protein
MPKDESGEYSPGVDEVIVSEKHLRERDGTVPRGPGDTVELVTHGKSIRTRAYGNHRYDGKGTRQKVTKVTERRDPRTGEMKRYFHFKPETKEAQDGNSDSRSR